jgi:hypothetical protein
MRRSTTQTTTTVSSAEGRTNRDHGMDRVERNAHPDWKRHAVQAVLRKAAEGGEFAAEDCWAYIPDGVWTHEPRAMGPVIKGLTVDGLISQVDWGTASKATSHCGLRRTYVATADLYDLLGLPAPEEERPVASETTKKTQSDHFANTAVRLFGAGESQDALVAAVISIALSLREQK